MVPIALRHRCVGALHYGKLDLPDVKGFKVGGLKAGSSSRPVLDNVHVTPRIATRSRRMKGSRVAVTAAAIAVALTFACSRQSPSAGRRPVRTPRQDDASSMDRP